MKHKNFNELISLLKLKRGDCFISSDCIIIFPATETFYGRTGIQVYYSDKIYACPHYGRELMASDFNNNDDYKRALKARKNLFHYYQDPYRADYIPQLTDALLRYVKANIGKGKRLTYRYYPTQRINFSANAKNFEKPTIRSITNRNLCKIERLELKGDVSGLYGTVATLHGFIETDWENEYVTWGTKFLLDGTVNPMLYGSVTNIYGTIHKELVGDISGITGDVTNLVGDCTGITLKINSRLPEKTNIQMLLLNGLTGKLRLLSNEQSLSAFNAYRKLAHCTLGLTKDERDLIDYPSKVKPPFNVDRWGRYYYNVDGETWVFSINPSDIMFLKELGPLNTCFCMTSQSANGRWHLGMRCLMALNCNNPNLGCLFKINKDESTRKMKMFKDMEFTWFKPQDGSFFQYNEKGEIFIWDTNHRDIIDRIAKYTGRFDIDNIQPIYGHDGINDGHTKQSKMAYLELFIGEQHSWVGNRNAGFKTPNKLTNNNWDICYDENWNRVCSSGEIISKENEEKFIKEAKMVKEIVNGIEI